MVVLTEVTFPDPQGPAPVSVAPEDVDDLYHTGWPFSARGLSKSFKKVVYRVGEIGDRKLRVGDRLRAFREEVGFGGGVVLTATISSLLDSAPSTAFSLQGSSAWYRRRYEEIAGRFQPESAVPPCFPLRFLLACQPPAVALSGEQIWYWWHTVRSGSAEKGQLPETWQDNCSKRYRAETSGKDSAPQGVHFLANAQ